MKKTRSLLAFPYIVWMIGFTVIPLLMVFYYGLTDRSGAFTLENLIGTSESDGLCFRLLAPKAETALYLIWKKKQVF